MLLGPVMREGRGAGGCSVESCVRELVDVRQVGVIEDDFDSIQRLRLSYSLQLHLHTHPFDSFRNDSLHARVHACICMHACRYMHTCRYMYLHARMELMDQSDDSLLPEGSEKV